MTTINSTKAKDEESEGARTIDEKRYVKAIRKIFPRQTRAMFIKYLTEIPGA